MEVVVCGCCVCPRGHIVRSLRHVDFFHRSPPGLPTSKHAWPSKDWFMIDEQSILILERVKVVGFWVFWVEADGPAAGRRRRARHRNPHSRPYARLGNGLHHPRAKTSLIGIGEPWKTLRQGPEPSVPANCPETPFPLEHDHRLTLAMMSLRVLQS